MQVIFRLAGVDGEATEPRIINLSDDKSGEDPEKIFAVTIVFANQEIVEQGQKSVTGIRHVAGTLRKDNITPKTKIFNRKDYKTPQCSNKDKNLQRKSN